MKTNLQTKRADSPRKHLKTVALIVLTIIVVAWLGRSLNWTEVKQSLAGADWRLLASATVIISLTYLLRAFRWQALLKPLTDTNLRDAFAATVIGFSAVFLLGRTGEIVRPALLPLRDRRVGPAASFVTILLERICDLAAIVLLFAINLIWFEAPAAHDVEVALVRKVGIALFIAAFIGLIGLVLFERTAKRVIDWLAAKFTLWTFVPQTLSKATISLLSQLATALRVLAYPRELAVTIFWTALLWLAIVVGNLLIIRGFGLTFGIRETIFVLGWALVGSLVPTPGGAAGAFHAATAAALIFLGVVREQAVAISIMVHLVDFAPALLFGFYYLMRGEISFGHLRQDSYAEGAG